jgi:hypothetical protein
VRNTNDSDQSAIIVYAFAGMWDVVYGIAGVAVTGKPLPMFRALSTVDILINIYIYYIFL